MDATLLFKLLVVAEGHVPAFSVKNLDPLTGPATIILKAHDLDRRDPVLVLRGRIVDDQGQPVARAAVSTFGYRSKDGRGLYGNMSAHGFDAMAVSNARGEFKLGVPQKDIDISVDVAARGFAPKKFHGLAAGAQAHDLALDRGVTVTGRVIKDGKPLAGVEVGLVQQDRGGHDFLGHFEIGADSQGVFTFLNVPANQKYFLYGLMDSCKAHGAIPVQKIAVDQAGAVADAGDVRIRKGHRLTGRIVLADGKPLPPGTRVILSRDQAWDHQTVEATADGAFSFLGLPTERYMLHVSVKGYHLSPKNRSFDLLNQFSLLGRVSDDVKDLRLLLDAGPQPPRDDGRFSQENLQEYQRRREAPLEGSP